MPHFLQRADGRRIAWEESGDLAGDPVFFFHGWPASRLQGAGFGPAAAELGLRIIAPDRPGIGLSTYQPGRQLRDWPPIVAEMAAHLGLDRYRVMAVSGGGPYAIATAWALPQEVIAAAVVSGAPPLPSDLDHSVLLPVYRMLLRTYRRRPGLLRTLFRWMRPFAILRPPRWTQPLILRMVPSADATALNDGRIFEGSWECYRESWRGDALGVITDAEVYAHPWGFPLEEVQPPIRLWHGTQDRNFSWKLAREMATHIPHCTTRFLEGEGHYSLPIRHAAAILQDLRDLPAVPAA